MDTPASVLRRRSQVFVEIPPSPLHSVMGQRASQANTPFKAVPTNVDNLPSPSGSPSLKRKLPDASDDTLKPNDEHQPPKAKKPKTENPFKQDAPTKKLANASNAGAQKSKVNDGSLRCHQCARLVGPSGIAQCTYKRTSGERCMCKYCKACLRNRYQLDIDTVKSRSPEGCSDEEKAKHAPGTDYVFQCPRCSEGCNCRACRKAKGLPALGDFNRAAREAVKQAAAANAAEAGPSSASGKSASASKIGKPSAKVKDANTKVKAKKAQDKTATKPKAGTSRLVPHVLVPPSPYKTGLAVTKKPRTVKEKPAPPPKPLPKPVWSQLSTTLTFDSAVERMHIREFLLRFAHLTDIARSHLEELEELAGPDPYLDKAGDNNEEEESDKPKLVGWISDAALRAILIGLLTLLSKDASLVESNNEDQDEQSRENDASALAAAIHQIKNSGSHLSKMWAALDTLRTSSSLDLPSALPPPPNVGLHGRSTRTTSRDPASASVPVISTAQLVPVVGALVEAALATEAVREDFERGEAQEKDLGRAARELAAKENARFRHEADKMRAVKTLGIRAEMRAFRAAHDAALASLNCAHQLALAECVPRFGPLGRDAEGRVYYAVTPGVVEREAAVKVLEGGKGEVRFGGKRRGVAEREERRRMKCWSWFVAVWGRKPEGAIVAKPDGEEGADEKGYGEGEVGREDEKEGEKEDEDTERWWGFWEPEEVAKLAGWLEKKHVPKGEDDTTVLDVDDGQQGQSHKRPRGRPSNASSAASSSAGGRTFASLNDSSDEDEGEGEDDRDEEDADGDVQMRLNLRGEPVPTKHDLRVLARGLKEYSELLAWRVKRASKEKGDDDQGDAEVEENGKSKGKAVAKPSEGIAPATFYGKK
ncbi:hypothetical protein BD310DRAFT_920405 [Dichomitus squalens]|uniref:Zinc-finger domain-containing protein n=1 Tax=Dichomitus squalens TaxID=114155 RepID=A0A4Q9Q3L8_9APHY|nr:hypothetical protein BD310DRAFT_920405 [Dichomitus squalens]